MSDKRSVLTDALETLGTIIDETAGRDAIHLAVEPVVAVEKLYPGQDVGLVDGGAGICDKPLGIVDPFLKAPVFPGQRFWLVVYPRQITSLRHVWTHPAFADSNVSPSVDSRAESEQWLRDLSGRLDISYQRLLDGADTWIQSKRNGDRWGEFLVGGEGMEGESTPPEFWAHYETVTENIVPEEYRENFFSCSC